MSEASEIVKMQERIRSLYELKGKPQPGDWLLKYDEAGQTFEQYFQSRRKPIRDEYSTLYLLPLGEFTPLQQKVLEATREMMEQFFGMPAKVLEAVSLDDVPAEARRVHPRWGDKQLLTTYLLNDVLKPRRPKDAVAVLGLTASDLWPGEGWNFVFGQASLTERVGVWSLYRNGNPEESREAYVMYLRRTLKTALHETGHMLGMQHCIAYECGMNGSNSSSESDRQPMEFCPECQAKVWWTCRVDPLRRTKALADLARSYGLTEEQLHWRQVHERMTASSKPRNGE
jgi:archaemetzincin